MQPGGCIKARGKRDGLGKLACSRAQTQLHSSCELLSHRAWGLAWGRPRTIFQLAAPGFRFSQQDQSQQSTAGPAPILELQA